MKVAALAGAAATLPGCEPAARKLIPYVVPDENVVPGMPSFYATTCAECPAGCGLVARIREGRATKLEGNPADPISLGATCARGQAGLQGLYNPDRLRSPQTRSSDGSLAKVNWEYAQGLLLDRLRAAASAGPDRVAFLGSPIGPSLRKVVRSWLRAWNSERAVFHEPIDDEAPEREAARLCFGRSDAPSYRIDRAEVLISFSADFLETWRSPVELARQYAAFRAPRERRATLSIGRTIYVGPRMSLTAARGDEWIAVAPGDEASIALAVLHAVLKQGWGVRDGSVDRSAVAALVADHDVTRVAELTGVPARKISELAEHFGRADAALALAGTDDVDAHVAANLLNAVTGNVGRTVVFHEGPPPARTSSPGELDELLAALRDRRIDVLVIAGGNPVFSMPRSAQFAPLLQRAPFVVWCGTVPDETAAMASLLLPIHHPLESWRDSEPRAGIRGLGQPVMRPVFDSRPLGDILIATAGEPGSSAVAWRDAAEAVKAQWLELAHQRGESDPDEFWARVRREGGLFEEPKAAPVRLDVSALNFEPPRPRPRGVSLFAYPHIFLYDGRGADKPWLQEIPEPVTQLVWDSWAEIHPDTARELGVAANQIVELRTATGVIEAAAYLTTLVAPGVIAVPIGQGHAAYGRYATGRGANPWAVLAANRRTTPVTARALARKRALVSPLGSADMRGRPIVGAASVEELTRGRIPEHHPHPPEPYEINPPHDHPRHHWGMTIDLNACTGCSACVAACYAENNLPVVGREGVEHGRVMSWIRIERYAPSPDQHGKAPLLYLMPMLCQQCDQAPCEPVCPVFAAYHTDEGLNGQIYNRCVGTRYCENNCPYKVRRFNWFVPEWPEPLNLQLNPDVTVRGAGVMEKCTFCVQRIRHAQISAKIDGRLLRDGEIVPACAEACPARAITFGDMNDALSAMMRRREENQPRGYRALDELNTQPSIVYLRDLFNSPRAT